MSPTAAAGCTFTADEAALETRLGADNACVPPGAAVLEATDGAVQGSVVAAVDGVAAALGGAEGAGAAATGDVDAAIDGGVAALGVDEGAVATAAAAGSVAAGDDAAAVPRADDRAGATAEGDVDGEGDGVTVARGVGEAVRTCGACRGEGGVAALPRDRLVAASAPARMADARLPLEDARGLFAAARVSKVARKSSAASLAAVVAGVAALAVLLADCALAAGWLGGSGAGSSGGGIRVCVVGRGEPLATQQAGRLGALEKSWPARRGSACCSAKAEGVGASLGTALKPDNPESDGPEDDRILVGASAVGLKLAMNRVISA